MTEPLSRRDFVSAAAAAGALAFLPRLDRLAPRPTNVLFILADDMGYGDLSSFGRPDYKTPILDRFAREGLRLTSVYTAGAVCTPTRCAWVTGRYPQRNVQSGCSSGAGAIALAAACRHPVDGLGWRLHRLLAQRHYDQKRRRIRLRNRT